VVQGQAFKDRQFTAEVILWAVRWYLMFPISYRDLALMLQDRGVAVDHTTIFRWIQAYAAELEKRIRPQIHIMDGMEAMSKANQQHLHKSLAGHVRSACQARRFGD
jgi:transposase-like protein